MQDDLFADSTIRDRIFTRKSAGSLLGSPQHLVDCDIAEADLSGLDMSRWTFERCNFRRTNLTGAVFDGTY